MSPRRTRRLLLLAVVLTFAAAGVGRAQERAPVTIRAGLLIDGAGDTRSDARIFVDGSTITRVDGLRGAVTYDLSDYTLMPGWIDTHVHLASHFEADGRLHQDGGAETPAQIMLHAVATRTVPSWAVSRRSRASAARSTPICATRSPAATCRARAC